MTLRGRGGRRVDSPREEALERRLRQATPDATEPPKPLEIRSSPFVLEASDYLKAAAGPPAWSARLLRLQQRFESLYADLENAREALRERYGSQLQERDAAWRAHVESLDLTNINSLIEKHNAYYPIEAGLRMQWPSGRYILPGGVQYPMPLLTAASLLEQFPALES
jgi:Rad3-related DNA helicase